MLTTANVDDTTFTANDEKARSTHTTLNRIFVLTPTKFFGAHDSIHVFKLVSIEYFSWFLWARNWVKYERTHEIFANRYTQHRFRWFELICGSCCAICETKRKKVQFLFRFEINNLLYKFLKRAFIFIECLICDELLGNWWINVCMRKLIKLGNLANNVKSCTC